MRSIIVNGHVIPGDGETVLRDHSVVIEDGIIHEVLNQSVLPYDSAHDIIDAGGGLIIPGVINHHSHGGGIGPFNVFGEKHLPLKRVMYNLNRHLSQGTTTIINACGWPTMAEIEMVNKLHPSNIRGTTIHTPAHLKHARFIDGRGIQPWHTEMTVGTMLARGAVAIGEAAAPCAAYGTPQIAAELGVRVSVPHVEKIKRAVLGPGVDPTVFNPQAVEEALKDAGLDQRLDVPGAKALMERHVLEPYEMTRDCVAELADDALKYKMPLLFHTTPDTRGILLDLAPRLGNLLIALHINYGFTATEAVAFAKELKKHGVWVDIFTGDAFGVRKFFQTPEVAFALLLEGCVDLVSTDYIAGYWDAILLVMEKAIEAELISLPRAVRKISRDVISAIPALGSERGMIAPGKVADIAIVHPKRISEVDTVLIGGSPVIRNGKIHYHPMAGV